MRQPEKLAEWWGPSRFSAPSLDLDVRSRGRYRITMQPPDGEAFHLRGEFREVDRPRRLVSTFEWEEPDPDDQETVVTLSFLVRLQVTVTQSVVTKNTAGDDGGGIYNDGGTVTLTDSAVSKNKPNDCVGC